MADNPDKGTQAPAHDASHAWNTFGHEYWPVFRAERDFDRLPPAWAALSVRMSAV